jgi:hypothetical protein
MRDIVLFAILLLSAIVLAPVWNFSSGWGLMPFAIATSVLFNLSVLGLMKRLRTHGVPPGAGPRAAESLS